MDSSNRISYPTVCLRTSKFQRTRYCLPVWCFTLNSGADAERGTFAAFLFEKNFKKTTIRSVWALVNGSCRKLLLILIFQRMSFSLMKCLSLVKMFQTHTIRTYGLLITRKVRNAEMHKTVLPPMCGRGYYMG